MLCQEHGSHASFADFLQQFVAANLRPRTLGDDTCVHRGGNTLWRRFEKAARLHIMLEQFLDFSPQLRVASTHLVQVRRTLGRVVQIGCGVEDLTVVGLSGVHLAFLELGVQFSAYVLAVAATEVR